jgi:tetratricopeptide (TPR) repeat protein
VRAWLEQYKGEWRRAEFGYFAATSMDPNDVTTRIWYSGFLVAVGKLSQGQAQAERALELDPGNPLTQAAMAMSEMVSGDNEACVRNAATALEMDFANMVNSLQGICLARLGRLEEARTALVAAFGPMDQAYALASLIKAMPGAENLQAAAKIAAASTDKWENDPWAIWVLALAGDVDSVFSRLQQGAASNSYFVMSLLWTPEAAGVRQDPRFLPYMSDIGVTRIWRNDPPDLCSSEGDEPFRCR